MARRQRSRCPKARASSKFALLRFDAQLYTNSAISPARQCSIHASEFRKQLQAQLAQTEQEAAARAAARAVMSVCLLWWRRIRCVGALAPHSLRWSRGPVAAVRHRLWILCL
jgi:hypothetical protein